MNGNKRRIEVTRLNREKFLSGFDERVGTQDGNKLPEGFKEAQL